MNIFMFVFLGFTFFTHVLEAKIPKSMLKNPNALMPDVWPKLIIILLLICLAINIVKIIKKNKGNKDFNFATFGKNTLVFLKSKMFIGMIILVVASLVLELLGFVVTGALMLFAFGLLLGQKKVLPLAIFSIAVALLLHIIFNGLLSVTLPRGEIAFLRQMSLTLESFVPWVKGLFGM